MTGYLILIPFLLPLLGVIVALFGNYVPGRDKSTALFGSIMVLGSAVFLALPISFADSAFPQLAFTGYNRFAGMGICVLAFIWLIWTSSRYVGRYREAVALVLFSTMGALLMVTAVEFVTLLIALELCSMPVYVLIGYHRDRTTGLEGSLKYYLLSVLTTTIMVYGISLIYGATGTTYLFSSVAPVAGDTLRLTGSLMVFVGIFGKLSVVPFHFWAPDAYSGSDSWAVSFASTAPKVAAIVVLANFTLALYSPSVPTVFLTIAALSMVVGSFTALAQEDIRKVMAYSSVVNAGYMIMTLSAIATAQFLSVYAVVMYAVFYGLAVMGILLICASEGDKVSDLAGLSKRRPAAAWGLVILCLSLIGVPPLAGFFGKFYLFTSAIAGGALIFVVLATVCSAVSAFYYLRFVRAAFFSEDVEAERANKEVSLTGDALVDGQLTENPLWESDNNPSVNVELEPCPKLDKFGGFAIALTVGLTLVLGPLTGVILSWMSGS